MELSKQSWFLGELSDDVAATTLKNSGGVNTFAVYKNVQKNNLILAIWQNEGVVIETRLINLIDGSYQIEGLPDVHGDIITAVTCFADNHNLMPAFDGAVTTQLGSSIDVPPSYDQAERLLQPDIAPLPPIGEIEKNLPVSEVILANSAASDPPPHGPLEHYYQDLHRFHPKNVWHYCCNYDVTWFLFPCIKGPLFTCCIVIVWVLLLILCFPCACVFCCFVIYSIR